MEKGVWGVPPVCADLLHVDPDQSFPTTPVRVSPMSKYLRPVVTPAHLFSDRLIFLTYFTIRCKRTNIS